MKICGTLLSLATHFYHQHLCLLLFFSLLPLLSYFLRSTFLTLFPLFVVVVSSVVSFLLSLWLTRCLLFLQVLTSLCLWLPLSNLSSFNECFPIVDSRFVVRLFFRLFAVCLCRCLPVDVGRVACVGGVAVVVMVCGVWRYAHTWERSEHSHGDVSIRNTYRSSHKTAHISQHTQNNTPHTYRSTHTKQTHHTSLHTLQHPSSSSVQTHQRVLFTPHTSTCTLPHTRHTLTPPSTPQTPSTHTSPAPENAIQKSYCLYSVRELCW